MSNQPEVSIIIPVYGVEKYIKKCIESIINQSFTDFECLIINDGTLDDSICIAKGVVGNDPRFIFIDKENGGQGSARNLGIDLAQGNYLAFIDSDDYINIHFLELMYSKITLEDSDACVCNVACVDCLGNIVATINNNVPLYYEKNDYFLSNRSITSFMCDKVFHKSIFETIRFDTSLRTHEDIYIVFEALFNKKITYVDKPLYNYLQRPGSTSKALHPSTFNNRVKIKNKYINFHYSNQLSDYDYLVYTYLRSYVFYMTVEIARYSTEYEEDVHNLKKEMDSRFFTFKNIAMVAKDTPKVGVSLTLFKLSPRIFRKVTHYWFRNHIA